MNYEFSITSFFIGLLILIVGVVFLRFHRAVANNLGKGVLDYDKFKLWAVLACILGFIVALNLHYFIFGILFQLVTGKSLK